jgi:hypothetical protein
VSQTGTKGSLRARTKASRAARRFWGDVAGPLVPTQIAAGTKGSRPKARFPLVIVFKHENRASNSEAHRVARSFVSVSTGRQVWLL